MTFRVPASAPRHPKFVPVPSVFSKGEFVELIHPIQSNSFEGSGFSQPMGISTLPSGTVLQVSEVIRNDETEEHIPLTSRNAMYKLIGKATKKRTVIMGSIKLVPHDKVTRNPKHGYYHESALWLGARAYLLAPRMGLNADESANVRFPEGTMVQVTSPAFSDRTPGRAFDGNLAPGLATDKTPLNHMLYNVDVVEDITYTVNYVSCNYIGHSLLNRARGY